MKTKKTIALAGASALALFLAACGAPAPEAPAAPTPQPEQNVEAPVEETHNDGPQVQEGRGMGLRGYIRLNVEHEDGVVTAIDPIFHNDSPDVFNVVFMALSNQLVGQDNFDNVPALMDMMSGATFTARGIINAVADVMTPGNYPVTPTHPHVDVTTQASPPIYSSFGHINEGSRPATDPLFPVGSTAMLAHEHFPGAAGSVVEITGAFYDPAYAVSFQPGAPGFPFEYAHRWIMHSELWGHEQVDVFQPGDLVMLYTDHFPGSRFVIGVIEYYEIGVTYEMSGHTRYGLPFWHHQWFAESEIASMDSDFAVAFLEGLGDLPHGSVPAGHMVYNHIAGHHSGSHVHGGAGQTYSAANGIDPAQLIQDLTDEQIQDLIDRGFADERQWRP